MAVYGLTSKGIGEKTNGFARDFTTFLSSRVDQFQARDLRELSAEYRHAYLDLHRVLKSASGMSGEKIAEEINDAAMVLIDKAVFLAYKAGHRDGVRTVFHSLAD